MDVHPDSALALIQFQRARTIRHSVVPDGWRGARPIRAAANDEPALAAFVQDLASREAKIEFEHPARS